MLQILGYVLFLELIVSNFIFVAPLLFHRALQVPRGLTKILSHVLVLATGSLMAYTTVRLSLTDPTDIETLRTEYSQLTGYFLLTVSKNCASDNLEFYCTYCSSAVDDHTKHCRICARCVRNFDHHCNWVNNCIAASNLE